MKKIFEEFISKMPQNKKHKIEEIIKLIEKNKPSFEIDKTFKKSLKHRLISYMDLKKSKKSSLFYFVPATLFGLFFVFSFVINFDFFNKDNIQEIETMESQELSPLRNTRMIKTMDLPVQDMDQSETMEINTFSIMSTDMVEDGFLEYCNSYWATLIIEEEKRYCEKEDYVCSIDEYIKNLCDFE